ncbi:hypothetical protein VAZ01S_090_00030 [Vibrio azureus NBRC 104587]|uniref:Uncharacterized protein n=1 Tax=Vibrio azureus NBRC 104587 TaxID=1219077 RepID=U3AX22_9VIBR|nr:hypothetical protein VAZ01S_090_00030 [Vibrio azureus NBRC 104587]
MNDIKAFVTPAKDHTSTIPTTERQPIIDINFIVRKSAVYIVKPYFIGSEPAIIFVNINAIG